MKTLLKSCPSITAGRYDFIQNEIHLNSIEKYHVEEANRGLQKIADGHEIEADEYESIGRFLPLLIHERAHWLDHHSTIWGLGLTTKIWKGLEAQPRIEKMGGLQRALLDEIDKIHYPDFYNAIDRAVDDSTPWIYNYSMGKLYGKDGSISSEPILFCSFFNTNEQRIVRVPLSIASMLEVNATYFEVKLKLRFLQSMKDGQREVQLAHETRELKNFIYSKEFGVYTVAAHVVANSIHETDILEALRIASVVSRICLNFPSNQFLKIKIPERYSSLWGKSAKNFLIKRNRAFLFFLIARSLVAAKVKSRTEEEVVTHVFECLEELGVNDYSIIQREALKEINLGLAEIKKIPHSFCDNYKTIFDENFAQLGLWNNDYLMENLTFPNVFLGSGEVYKLNPSLIVEVMSRDVLEDYSSFLMSFKPACLV